MNKMEICKVYYNKASGVKLLTVPKRCDIAIGDYVQIQKVTFEKVTLGEN